MSLVVKYARSSLLPEAFYNKVSLFVRTVVRFPWIKNTGLNSPNRRLTVQSRRNVSTFSVPFYQICAGFQCYRGVSERCHQWVTIIMGNADQMSKFSTGLSWDPRHDYWYVYSRFRAEIFMMVGGCTDSAVIRARNKKNRKVLSRSNLPWFEASCCQDMDINIWDHTSASREQTAFQTRGAKLHLKKYGLHFMKMRKMLSKQACIVKSRNSPNALISSILVLF